jgi:hypothetical protein
VGGSVDTILRVLTTGWLLGVASGRSIGVLAVKEGPDHFKPLGDLCAGGSVKIYVDRTFGLDHVPAALAYVGEGLALGKLVVPQS